MGSGYSDDLIAGDHIRTNIATCNIDLIAGDHIQTNIATCNTEEPQQKYHLGTVGDRSLMKVGGSLNMFTGCTVNRMNSSGDPISRDHMHGQNNM